MKSTHVIKLSILVVLISIFLNIVLCKQFIVDDVILYEVSQNHKNLVFNYQNTVWNSYMQVAKKQRTSAENATKVSPEYLRFLRDTSRFFQNSEALRIDILDDRQTPIFSSSEVEISEDNDKVASIYDYIASQIDDFLFAPFFVSNWMVRAYEGEVVQRLMLNARIIPPLRDKERIAVAVDYVPILGRDGHTQGVVVFYIDATHLIEGVWGVEHRIIVLSSLLAIIFCGIIAYNTYHTQRIIKEQLKVNKFLEEAKSKAEHENSAKTEFLAGVSHELRTPLNAIIGFSEIILSEHGQDIDRSQYEAYIKDIHHSGRHLLSIINDILDYSKAATDKLVVDMIDVDVSKIVRSSMRLVSPRALEKNIELVETTPTDQVVINADPKRLKQAILNLLSNSIKFTPENGKVVVSVTQNREKRLVSIKIIDTGIGIAEEDIHKALSTFGQVDNSMSRKYDGTGLGLPLTKKLVELMNGIFEITSTEGVGTTVSLTFPCKDA